MVTTAGAGLVCRDLVEVDTTYLEGALEPVGAGRFEAHVTDCSGCATHLRGTRRMLDVLSALPDQPPSLEVRRGLQHAFRVWRARVRSRPQTSGER